MNQFLAALALASALVGVGYFLPALHVPPAAHDRKERKPDPVPPGKEEDYQQVLDAFGKSEHSTFSERVLNVRFQDDSKAIVTFSWSKHSGTATLEKKFGHWLVVDKVYHV